MSRRFHYSQNAPIMMTATEGDKVNLPVRQWKKMEVGYWWKIRVYKMIGTLLTYDRSLCPGRQQSNRFVDVVGRTKDSPFTTTTKSLPRIALINAFIADPFFSICAHLAILLCGEGKRQQRRRMIVVMMMMMRINWWLDDPADGGCVWAGQVAEFRVVSVEVGRTP